MTRRPEGPKIRGDWPGPVEFSSGWARASARPWNEDLPAASLRLERGGSRFLRTCAQTLTGWVDEVLSPATLPGGGRVWREAGFVESGRLLLFEHPLTSIAEPGRPVIEDPDADLAPLNRIDRESFSTRWRLGPLGLAESVAATGRAMIHTVSAAGELAGFAITGVSLGVGYLQRLAVDPRWRGEGIGRALVRESLRWARRRRVVTVLVNTQPDNDAAARLYLSEGFSEVPAGLRLWTFRG